MALVILWQVSDWICGKRPEALLLLLLESMEGNGHMGLAPEIAYLLVISARNSLVAHLPLGSSCQEATNGRE